MKCPWCSRENPESAIRCGHCRASLHDSIDDRTMDSPGHSGSMHGDAKPSFATSDFKDTMVRTPSGHSPSQSRFQIDELLGEGGKARKVCKVLVLGRQGASQMD